MFRSDNKEPRKLRSVGVVGVRKLVNPSKAEKPTVALAC